MRVFLSSVRRGLEEERDALPGLITAIGHEPVRFEDFTASTTPSREACLAGVQSSDVYVLLIGPNYGHRFPDTMQSPTHDEWVAATMRGLPRLVFVKQGIELDDDQKKFVSEIGDYGSGVFYDTFTSAIKLQQKVVQSLRNVAEAPSELQYSPLPELPTITWRRDDQSGRNVVEYPQLELHVQPLPARRLSGREFRELSDTIGGRVRSTGVVGDSESLSVSMLASAISIAVPERQSQGWNEPRSSRLLEVRLFQQGQVTVCVQLPGDSLGAVLDPEELPKDVTRSLRIIGQFRVIAGDAVAIAVGLDPASQLSVGSVTRLPRTQASFGLGARGPIRIEPDEAISVAALSTGAEEVGRHLARSLIDALR